jgi:methyl-accepting chemotaxis protein
LNDDIKALADVNNKEIAAQAEMLDDYFASRSRVMVGVALVGILAAVGFAVFVGNIWIVRPIRSMTAMMGALAGGSHSTQVPHLENRDEIGDMARAVEVFRQNAVERERLEAAQATEQAAREQRAGSIRTLTGNFEQTVTRVLGAVGKSIDELDGTAQSMAAIAEQTNRQAQASAADQTSGNVQTVASAAEEMACTLQEISRQVSRSTTITAQATHEAETVNITVQELADSAQRIGQVVQLINEIASKTNLLALNATIEAARAGEAGKGFAVVASEVKALANQTAKATGDIEAQIVAMQSATGGAVEAISGIAKTIGTLNEVATTIASAVEEQTAATSAVARNVQQAAAGTQEVSTNVAQVTHAAGQTGMAAAQVLSATADLSKEADQLRQQVESFLSNIRTA